MASQKFVTIFGATGNQGSSVARSLLSNKDKAFQVRGITRNPDSDKAKELSSLGVEVVKGDGWNKEEMVKAFSGSWGVFLNTNSDDPYFEDPSHPTEIDLGKLLVDAAAEAGVKHLVYSSAESSKEVTNGEIDCETFENKHTIELYARSKTPSSFMTFTPIIAGYYLENYLSPELAEIAGGFPMKADEEGIYTLYWPKFGGKEEIPFISIMDDFGDHVHAIFIDPERYNGKVVSALSEILSYDGLVEAFSKATGKKARFVPMASWKDFPTYGMKPLENAKTLFATTIVSGGLYFGYPTEDKTSKELKHIAARETGKTGDEVNLISAEAFFRKYLGAASS